MSSGANITYASRKRRKPVQKTVKPVPAEGIKSNPSKRHRDRLNTELDRLASLLPFPQDVINKLDKLSVLRLSVSYLRAKSFFDVALKSSPADRNGGQDQCRAQVRDGLLLQEGEFLLQALNGFVLVVTADALVFYASSTIQDYLGFQQSDVIHQSVYELIHTEDRAEFQRQLHWGLNPTQCTDSAQAADDAHGLPQPPAVYFSPDQLPPENASFLERCFICRLRCLLDNSSGFLAMNFQGRLKYLHGQNKKGKDGALLPPQLALFAIATPLQPPSILEIRTKNFIFRTKHKLDFTPIGCDAKDEEGREHLQKRSMTLPFMFATGEAVLYEISSPFPPMMDPLPIRTKSSTDAKDWALQSTPSKDSLHPSSLMNAMIQQDESIYLCPASSTIPLDSHFLSDSTSECGGWQDGIAAIGSESVFKHEQIGHAQDMNPALSGEPPDIFPDHKNNDDLYSIMRNLGIDFDDIQRMQSEEFFRADLSIEADVRDFDITDEILTYVQDSLNKSTLLNSASQQQPATQHLSCMLQERLHLEQQQQQQLQQQQHQAQAMEPQHQLEQIEPQQQLCHQLGPMALPQQELGQKAKHMQVNGMFASWNSAPPVPLSHPQQELKHYNVFPDLPATVDEFPYKPEVDGMPYAQNFAPCNQTLLPPHSDCASLDFPGKGFEPSLHPTTTSLEDFLTCLQVPENQRPGVNPQSAMVTPQAYYAGAMSMYQCQPGTQHTPGDQMQYSSTVPGSQAFINKYLQRNGPPVSPMSYAREMGLLCLPGATREKRASCVSCELCIVLVTLLSDGCREEQPVLEIESK
ncbi:Aryl hydrocarbon receptor [Microtus ochrogaster]|uniref:Aryl hydrocarbon receptor n=1 Tax=Microtus ochrogaster TaxID=79684 RepID=A0A8J6GCF1_MICOH|nr:Aryl hydrocarbon receptor [Microtus ochrogaster]